MTMLEAALSYHRRGWTVIPLAPRTKDRPLVKWEKYQTEKPTEGDIREWWTAQPDANIAVVTGHTSDVTVIDVDKRGQLLEFTESILRALTGRGEHHYFRNDVAIRNSQSLLGDGIDVRAEGGYVLAPPSIHPNGHRYRWVDPKGLSSPLPVLPEVVRAKLLQKTGPEPDSTPRNPEGWIAAALGELKHGNRNVTFLRILGRLRNEHWSREDAVALLRPAAERVEAGEILHKKAEYVWKHYEPRTDRPGAERMDAGAPVVHSADEDFDNGDVQPNRPSLYSGFPTLDGYLEGGLRSERLFVVAARTGVGKTNLLLGISDTLCRNGNVVLYFSSEFSFKKIIERYRVYSEGHTEDQKKRFFVCDSFTPSLTQIEEVVRKVMPQVFIFDHINHVTEDVQKLGDFSRGLNFLQRKYDCQGILAAQLNRDADWIENGQKVTPRLSMIKGSDTIGQGASRVLLLSETKVTPEYNEITGVLDKNDSGEKGMVMFGLYKKPYMMKELPC